MITKSLVEILPVVAAPRNRVENWLLPQRLQLRTRFQEPDQGMPRAFTRDNALELALIAAFVKAGARASSAVALAGGVLRGQGHGGREWWIFTGGDMTKGVQRNEFDFATVVKDASAAAPPIVTLVHVGEIVRRVDKLFSEGE